MSNNSITTITEELEDVPTPISRNIRSVTGFTDSLGDYSQSNPEIIVKQQTFSDVEVKYITESTSINSSLDTSVDVFLNNFINEASYSLKQESDHPLYEAQHYTIEKNSKILNKLNIENEDDSFKRLVFHDGSFKAHFEKHVLNFGTPSITHDKECKVCKYCRVVGDELFQNHTQEPWPKDVRLFQPYEVEQILLPDNANCLAVQTFLKMCDLDYTVDPRANAEAMSPTGKVPFIKCGAFIVAEMEGIVQFVGNRGISLTQDMSAENKSDMRAYMTLVNNVLGNAELYICWSDNETYQDVTKPRYGSIYPWPLNHIQAWTKRSEEIKKLRVLGWYDKTMEEVYNDVETCCQALTDRLDGHEYFFGSKYTELDALVYGHLFLMLTVPITGNLGEIVKKYPKLVEFCLNINSKIMGKTDLSGTETKTELKKVSFQGIATNLDEENLISKDKLYFSESTISLVSVIKDWPTELEALIFGHLYTILTTPLPNATLPNTVKNFPQLINLITRIEKKYFQKETKH